MMSESPQRSPLWIWWVCGLLLLASTINYMDRQTLSNISQRITNEFELSDEQYGNLELAFGLAFAVGATVFGIIADRTNVRFLYPIVLLLWSVMGFATGFVQTYAGLLICRLLLGFFEAGHWPCALKTTQRLLPPDRRTLGNSVLQSGTAIGAIATPQIMRAMLTPEPGSWRPAFQLVGALGLLWVVLWLVTIRKREWNNTTAPATPNDSGRVPPVEVDASFREALFSRKFVVLLIIVMSINCCWHLFRVWLPKFLQAGRGYTENEMFWINTWFNVMTDVGCICAGILTAALCYRGFSVHASRRTVFALCSTLVALGGLIPWLPKGPVLLVVLMIVGAGALGLFPCYYSLSQELTRSHQGKITGMLGTVAWVTTSPLHPLFGRLVDNTKSYDLGLCLASLTPLVALVALFTLWPRESAPVAATPD
jgi:ACS family hexuronate transporter-like MFS transporter